MSTQVITHVVNALFDTTPVHELETLSNRVIEYLDRTGETETDKYMVGVLKITDDKYLAVAFDHAPSSSNPEENVRIVRIVLRGGHYTDPDLLSQDYEYVKNKWESDLVDDYLYHMGSSIEDFEFQYDLTKFVYITPDMLESGSSEESEVVA